MAAGSAIPQHLLEPETLAGLANLDLVARAVVNGFLTGMHRSPFFGFSQEFAEYRAYAEAIRREYAFVPDQLYRPGRRRALEGFLARERIYLTDRLGALWERAARTNLAGEIAELVSDPPGLTP